MPPVSAAYLRSDRESLRADVRRHLRYSLARLPETASSHDVFQALALSVRDRLAERMLDTEARYRRTDAKRLYYLSMEFLLGRSLESHLVNLGLREAAAGAMADMGRDLTAVMDQESDAALGNGGLGRLAACLLDSLASQDYPGFGYGLHYELGLFHQEIENGRQREKPDRWLKMGSPWEIERPEEACMVPVYGRIEHTRDLFGHYNPMWLDWRLIVGVPRDFLISGYGGRTVNRLRLYAARASDDFDMEIFNQGDYLEAVKQKITSETISKILYPSDSIREGRELRLVQEYFFTACAIRDIVRRYRADHDGLEGLADRVAIQLNDTHPALAVAELMRLLVDEEQADWDAAWETVRETVAYTNHTLLHEALEKWPVDLFERVLPRHLQIIYEINHRFLKWAAAARSVGPDRLERISIIEEGPPRQVRMAHLAIRGSHAVNGVARLHTRLLTETVVPDFHDLWPDRFVSVTNGITHRRWLLTANPALADLITDRIGPGWITDPEQLDALRPAADEPDFRAAFRRVKAQNKARLTEIIRRNTSVTPRPDTLFDVQVKRIHEYKRQLLNILGIIHRYLSIVEDGRTDAVGRTFIFAGKAAPGYWAAKEIIHLIHRVGRVINADRRLDGRLKVVFIPDYRVSLAERIIPAAEVSEQISTAGTEASGTGNMKLALNGALTVGTLDGATIEMRDRIGAEHLFLFGHTADALDRLRSAGGIDPRKYYDADPRIRRVMDTIASDRFCPEAPEALDWIFDTLVNRDDPYCHLADLGSYIDAQDAVDALYRDPPAWDRKAILNIAGMGYFSSDRTVATYARKIWSLSPCPPDGIGPAAHGPELVSQKGDARDRLR